MARASVARQRRAAIGGCVTAVNAALAALGLIALAISVPALACQSNAGAKVSYCSEDAQAKWAVSAHTYSANRAATAMDNGGWQISGAVADIPVQQNAASANGAWRLTGGARSAPRAAAGKAFQLPAE